MRRGKILTLAVLTVSWAGPARAGSEAFDEGMKPLVEEYLKIQQALAGDGTRGVTAAAAAVERLAAGLGTRAATGPQATRYAALPGKIRAAAVRLKAAKDLKSARAAFKELSRPLVLWATLSKAPLNVVFCSMAKGSWLQREKTIGNPYYGASMLRCGEVVSGPDKGAAGGHMQRGH